MTVATSRCTSSHRSGHSMDLEYTDVVDRPTPWSSSMRPSFRNFLRQPCELASSVGVGMAGSIATLRFSVQRPVETAAWGQFLQQQLSTGGVTALHLGVVDVNAKFPVSNAAATDVAGGTPHVLLVEATDRQALTAQCRTIADSVFATADCAREPDWETYDLAFVIAQSDLPEPRGRRQAERADLRRRWAS